MRKINYIVVHCSATREGCTLTSEALEADVPCFRGYPAHKISDQMKWTH